MTGGADAEVPGEPEWPELTADFSVARHRGREAAADHQSKGLDFAVADLAKRLEEVVAQLADLQAAQVERPVEQPSETVSEEVVIDLRDGVSKQRHYAEQLAVRVEGLTTETALSLDRVATVESALSVARDENLRLIDFLEQAFGRLDHLETLFSDTPNTRELMELSERLLTQGDEMRSVQRLAAESSELTLDVKRHLDRTTETLEADLAGHVEGLRRDLEELIRQAAVDQAAALSEAKVEAAGTDGLRGERLGQIEALLADAPTQQDLTAFVEKVDSRIKAQASAQTVEEQQLALTEQADVVGKLDHRLQAVEVLSSDSTLSDLLVSLTSRVDSVETLASADTATLKVEKLHAELMELSGRLDSADRVVDSLASEVRGLPVVPEPVSVADVVAEIDLSAVDRLEGELVALRAELSEREDGLRAELSARMNSSADSLVSSSEVSELQSELVGLRAELSGRLDSADRVVDSLASEVRGLPVVPEPVSVADVVAEIDLSAVDRLEGELVALRAELSERTDLLRSELAGVESDVAAVDLTPIGQLDERIHALARNMIETRDALAADIENIAARSKHADPVENDVAELRAELASIQDRIHELNKSDRNTIESLGALGNHVAELHDTHVLMPEALATLTQRIDSLEGERISPELVHGLREELTRLENHAAESGEHVSQLIDEEKQRSDRLREELASTTGRLDGLAPEIDALRTDGEELTRLRGALDEHERILGGMQSVISTNERRLEQMGDTIPDVEDILVQLDADTELEEETPRQPLLQIDNVGDIEKADVGQSTPVPVSDLIGDAENENRAPSSPRPPVVANYNLKKSRLRRK